MSNNLEYIFVTKTKDMAVRNLCIIRLVVMHCHDDGVVTYTHYPSKNEIVCYQILNYRKVKDIYVKVLKALHDKFGIVEDKPNNYIVGDDSDITKLINDVCARG